jgi:phage terminase large subunit-like protein
MLASNAILVKPEAAKRELARRELARRHLVDYQKYINPWYRPGRHHILVGAILEQVLNFVQTKGETGIGRLLILEPPRHGKSQQGSIDFPSFFLGKLPDDRVIITSYGLDLAADFSKKIRDIVTGDRYANVFGRRSSIDTPIELSSDSRSMKAWDLSAPYRGGVVAAGVGGGISGKGAHLFIVDDPFKNREEADSESHRDKVWEWWQSTAYTRLEDGAAVIGILTHWHGDDWAGRLMKAMATDPKADQWKIISLMARWELPELPEDKKFEEYRREQMLMGNWVELIDPLDRKPGEALWPDKYNEEDLERIEANLGPYEWAALYQQNPYSRVGGMFKREWFSIVDELPKDEEGKLRLPVIRVRYYDKAGTEGGGAFTSGVCMSLYADGFIYVEDVNRGQWGMYHREEEMLKTAQLDKKYRPGKTITWHPQDPGSAGKDSAQATNAKLAAAGLEAHFELVTGSKEVRAGPWSSICEAGKVRLLRGGWNNPFIEEHVAFSKGKYKDQVDGASGAYSKMLQPGAEAMDNPFYGDES